jgi:hypothetical protein
MQSADHYSNEVQMTKTELAQLLQTASDTVMTVSFHKKMSEDNLTH